MLSQLISQSGVPAGWLAWAALGVAVIAYFLGGFNGAVVISRFILQDDIRNHGSGNAGLTNFLRTFGGPLTFLVICADAIKALLSVVFGMYIASMLSVTLITAAKYWSGLFCLLGHMFPATFGFRGGKGILSGGVIALLIDWRVALVVWGGFILLVALTRYVSLGSCWAAASFPVASWFVFRDPLVLLLSVVMGGLILWKHRGNIVRLVRGTESKLSIHKSPGEPAPAAAPGRAPKPPKAKKDPKPAKPAKLKKEPKAAKPPKSEKKTRGKRAPEEPAAIPTPEPDGPWIVVNDLPYGGWKVAAPAEKPSRSVKRLPSPQGKSSGQEARK